MTDSAKNVSDESPSTEEVLALQRAFRQFSESTATLESAYRELSARAETLDQELAQKHRELAVATDYLNSILEGMSDGVIAVNEVGDVTLLNRAARAILGLDAETVIGKSFETVFGRPLPETGRLVASELRTRDGGVVPVSERLTPLEGKHEAALGSVLVFQDLTELEDLRERVQRKDRLAAIGEMAATVAHEIRNPLGGVRGFAALLQRDLDDNDPKSRLVEKILEGTRNLDHVVNELLEFTRPVELEIVECATRELIDAAIELCGVDRDRIEVSVDVPDSLTVYADTDRLRQVFLNILLNAQQSIAGTGQIAVSCETRDTEVLVVFADTGCGMSDEQLAKIFSPFYTTKEKGTGLGLAVASRIVDEHGGSLRADSTPGKGSVFVVALANSESLVS